MTAEEKIDMLCSEHLNICSMEDIILPKERNALYKHYECAASEKIVAILEDMDES